MYSSDSENECLKNFNDILDDHNYCILKFLASWIIENNITLLAFSELLRFFKMNHKCFSNFPTDARTVLKIQIQY